MIRFKHALLGVVVLSLLLASAVGLRALRGRSACLCFTATGCQTQCGCKGCCSVCPDCTCQDETR